MLIAGQRHLHAVLAEYAVPCREHRPRRGRPDAGAIAPVGTADLVTSEIRGRMVLGGLINESGGQHEDPRLFQETAVQKSWPQFWHPTGIPAARHPPDRDGHLGHCPAASVGS
jgi:hypothetical protein